MHRLRTHLHVRRGSDLSKIQLLVTTARLDFRGERQVLPTVEDVTDLFLLQNLLPICAPCKSIRDDQGYWAQVDNYLNEHANLKFTHGLCSSCVSNYLPSLGRAAPNVSLLVASWSAEI